MEVNAAQLGRVVQGKGFVRWYLRRYWQVTSPGFTEPYLSQSLPGVADSISMYPLFLQWFVRCLAAFQSRHVSRSLLILLSPGFLQFIFSRNDQTTPYLDAMALG